MKNSKSSDRLLTPKQLVARWGGAVALSTLKRWRSRGLGPPWMLLGRRVFYSLASVAAWELKSEMEALR